MLSEVIATSDTLAMINAMMGKNGYMGVLNGRANADSFFLSTNTAIIEITYNVNAAKHDMMMISPVLPVSNATMPMSIFNNNALAGVLNFA